MTNTERKQVIRTEGGGGAAGGSKNGCERTPLRVQEFMGYKSTEDPLFKVEKLMLRAQPLLVDPDNVDKYLEAVTAWSEHADNGSVMAYTSSWGEANPNGGKENIDSYLAQTKMEVEESADLLKAVMDFLGLKEMAPLKGPL